MKKVLAFFAEGTEEIECLMVVDILRRAGVSVELIAVAPENLVKGSHQITILCDKNISEPVSYTHLDVYKRQMAILKAELHLVVCLRHNKPRFLAIPVRVLSRFMRKLVCIL